MRRAPALAAVLVLLALPPAAGAQVVTLQPHPGPELSQGPQLAGARIAWSQTRCLRGCDIEFASEGAERYEVWSRGPGRHARRIFDTRLTTAFSGPNFGFERFSFLASDQVLATVHGILSGDELDGESGAVRLRAGPPAARRPLLVSCSAEFFEAVTTIALDGSRIVFDPAPCDDVPRLVLRDLATGATQALPDPAVKGSEVRLRGDFVGWVERDRLVVHDLAAGTTRSAAVSAAVALDLDTDGTVAAVAGDLQDPCRTGRLLRWSPDAAAPAELDVPVCASGVRIDRGRIVVLGREGFFRTLQAVGPGGEVEDLVRFGRVLTAGFDARGGRIAWTERDCGGGEAIFATPLVGPPHSAGPIKCRARFRPGAAPVERGIATVRLTCPRGCGGELSLRHAGRRDFSLLQRGERRVRVRLRPAARRRLERSGSIETIAKLVTRNRAGDRLARSRAVTR